MAASGSDDGPRQHPRGRCLEGTDDPNDTMLAGRAEHSLVWLIGDGGERSNSQSVSVGVKGSQRGFLAWT